MIGGERGLLQGQRTPYWHTLRHLRQQWNRIDVLCPRGPKAGPVAVEFEEAGADVWLHPAPKGIWHQPGWIKQKAEELMKEREYALITAHMFPPFYASNGAIKIERGQTPLLMELHGLPGFPEVANVKDWLGAKLSRGHIPGAVKKADALRVVNPDLIEYLQTWGIERTKMHYVPAIYLDAKLIESLPPAERTTEVVFCGRLEPNKGIMDVIEAVEITPGCTLKVIGDGPLRCKCECYVKRRKLTDRITFVGWLDSQEAVLKEMQSARMLIMASRFEGGPRVVFEAMAVGTVPIVTKVGLMPTVITADENGLFTSGHANDIALCIKQIQNDDEYWLKMSENAKKVNRDFAREKTLKEYGEFLKTCAS